MKKYEQIRSLIKSGDILAWTHRGWGSWHDIQIQLVRFFTRSEYSHVATAWVVGERVFVIEAVQPKVRIYPLSALGEFYWISLDTEFKDSTLEYALSKVGNDYSKLQAVLAPFDEPSDDNKQQCAELTARIARVNGTDLGRVYTPSAIVRMAQLNGAELRLVQKD